MKPAQGNPPGRRRRFNQGSQTRNMDPVPNRLNPNHRPLRLAEPPA